MSAGPIRSIAILPLANMSSNPENEYFSDGMTEEIITALTRIEGLQVTARTSSFAFKNKNLDIREIGQHLGVSTILEGSVRMSAKKVRITAQLIDTKTGFHLWAENFDRELDDLFAVQDEISLLIAEKLREHTSHFDIADQLVRHPGVSTATYQEYLKGRYLVQKFNKLDVEKGLLIFQDLIEEVPDFPLPYLGLNYGYTFLGALGLLPVKEAFQKGRHYLDQAVALAPDLAECHLRQAGLTFWQEWDFEKTYKHLNKVLVSHPGNAEAHLWMGVALATEGRFEAAMHSMDRALQLDPFSILHNDFKGVVFYFQEAYDEAIAYFQKCRELDPTFVMSQVNWAAAELMRGNHQAGFDLFNSLPPSGQAELSKLGGTTLALAMQGQQEIIEEKLEKVEDALQSPVGDRALFFLVLINIVLENFEKALDYLESGVQQKVAIFITMGIEPFFKPLRQFPRFQALYRQVMPKPHDKPVSENKYVQAPLDQEEAKTYLRRLEELMAHEKPYLDPKLSLREMATMLEWNPNYLSRLINEYIGKNFSEYVNSYRLQAFKRLAQLPENQHLTLLALAFESGFNSKTVFNSFFKKTTGMTPKAYLKHLQK